MNLSLSWVTAGPSGLVASQKRLAARGANLSRLEASTQAMPPASADILPSYTLYVQDIEISLSFLQVFKKSLNFI